MRLVARGSGANEEGFTLIELLVVVLIISVLTAVAVPIFIGQQAGARDAAALTDLRAAKGALIAWEIDHDGELTTDLNDLVDGGYATSALVTGTSITINLAGNGFCIEATSSTGNTYSVTDTTGAVIAPCTGSS